MTSFQLIASAALVLSALGAGLLLEAREAPRDAVKLAPRAAAPRVEAPQPSPALQDPGGHPPALQAVVLPATQLVRDGHAAMAPPAREIHAAQREPRQPERDAAGAMPEPAEDSN